MSVAAVVAVALPVVASGCGGTLEDDYRRKHPPSENAPEQGNDTDGHTLGANLVQVRGNTAALVWAGTE